MMLLFWAGERPRQDQADWLAALGGVTRVVADVMTPLDTDRAGELLR